MKIRLTVIVLLVVTSSSALFGQGQIWFANGAPVTIGSPSSFEPDPVGTPLRSDYSASLYYLPGNGYSQSAFDNSNPIWVADCQFGATPGDAFNGFFNDGYVTLPFAGTVTVEVRAWFSGAAMSYGDALSKGYNVGESVLVSGAAEPSPAPLSLLGLPAFTVQAAPEPSAAVLFGFGVVLLLASRFRARKVTSA
jgi:hypothetical protein